MYLITNQIFDKLKNEVLIKDFCVNHEIDYDYIENYIFGDEFYSNLIDILENRRFKAREVAVLFEPIILKLNKDENITKENYLEYIYNYALYKSFPKASSLMSKSTNFPTFELALRIMQIVFAYEKNMESQTWQYQYPINLLDKEDYMKFESRDEYRIFCNSFKDDFVYEMMKLNQDLAGFSTLDHICGVNYLAMKIGWQLHLKKINIDLGRVSGAAIGHDIGKYGCRPHEMKKVAYYHYYYSGEWFKQRGISYIRNVAINHSTWDLELENLSLESLLLIYADFRVKQGPNRKMKFYDLDESFDVILKKLDDLTEAKINRYKRVYAKLVDFENYLFELGIDVGHIKPLDKENVKPPRRRYFSLYQGDEVIKGVKFLSIRNNIMLMNKLRSEDSLNEMLDSARVIDNYESLRGYMNIIEEYHDYLTQKQKHMVIKFLYERLTSPEEDIRYDSSYLIGELIGKIDEKYRKELPEDANIDSTELNSDALLVKYLEMYINPEHKIIEKHRKLISKSFYYFIKGYFNNIEENEKLEKTKNILNLVHNKCKDSIYKLCYIDLIKALPIYLLNNSLVKVLIINLVNLAKGDDEEKGIYALDAINFILPFIDKTDLIELIESIKFRDNCLAYNYALETIHEQFGINSKEEIQSMLDKGYTDLFLNNLKSATLPIIKKMNVDLLLRNAIQNNDKSFYTALHFSNLLKVSGDLMVRNQVGEGLVILMPYLSFEEKNDIVIELLRALEMENYQFSRYIPEYLGILLLHLKPSELDEVIDDFKDKIKKSNSQISSLILKTVGVFLVNYKRYKIGFQENEEKHEKRYKDLIGIIMNGYVSYQPTVNQVAITVLGKDIFGSKIISIEDKLLIFEKLAKKTISLMSNNDETIELNFLSNAAGIKHIYRFVLDYNFYVGEIKLKKVKKVAFFPGAFDPFSLSHKQIASIIRDMGFEVYLSVDEFSWSKRTQPNLIRRDIIKMSVADELGLFVFPRDLQINIANEKDVNRLKKVFPHSEVYMVAGSDVILNASAYNKSEKDTINSLKHIIFPRVESNERKVLQKTKDEITSKGVVAKYLELHEKFSHISSTQIRTYIDENRDISELIDPLAQKYIYEKGIYMREPQFKEAKTSKSLSIVVVDNPDTVLVEEIRRFIGELEDSVAFKDIARYLSGNKARILIIRDQSDNEKMVAFSIFHWIRSSNMFFEFDNSQIEEKIRNNSVGRVIMIDGIKVNNNSGYSNLYQILLTETLAFAMSKDYSYCVYREKLHKGFIEKLDKLLINHGFLKEYSNETDEYFYHVNMSNPCTLSLDLESMIKEPFASNHTVMSTISIARSKLQKAIADLYPGQLVLSFDKDIVYDNLINKICKENGVPSIPMIPKITGPHICVPFGEIFRKSTIPNTITKSLHTEKFIMPNGNDYQIKEFPYYLDIKNQINMIKSFDKEVILVDDLLHKGYRIRELHPRLLEQNVNVKKVFVGILSGRGKAYIEKLGWNVDSAYFLPRLNVWFSESKLYPFLGGDTLWRGAGLEKNLFPSINLIMPYTSASYIQDVPKMQIFNLSKVALANSIMILKSLEKVYSQLHERSLTIANMAEVFYYPRIPDRGIMQDIDLGYKPSYWLNFDLEHLERLESIFDCEGKNG
jgi:nicotinic acid mononucleotide adenylyltransferase